MADVTGIENPYDELAYRSLPVEWSAPEQLAVTSLLHGGPRMRLDSYRVLELGCGDGTNLIALAYYRRHGEFVGIDGSGRHIEAAKARATRLGLDNLSFIHADLREATTRTEGRFDYVLAHGVFSWVPDDVREALLHLHHERMQPNGLMYLNYNTLPGWSVRGLVRRFLLAQTAAVPGLRARTEAAQTLSSQLAATLMSSEHPYSQLMAREFRIVADAELTYVAHEYLNPENHAYWRSEFRALALGHGLAPIADADFTHAGGRSDPALDGWLETEGIVGCALEDTSDLVRYRQLHSPILARVDGSRSDATPEEVGALFVATTLTEIEPTTTVPALFRHDSGETLEITDESMRAGLSGLAALWPRGLRVSERFDDVAAIVDDLRLLHRFGLIDLRVVEPHDFVVRDPINRLNALEATEQRELTSAYHRRSPPTTDAPAETPDVTPAAVT